ncbi:MAG: OmpA family protein [Azonexus sp.]|jgi:outer membrane protein OmpA-like peptidoglycan-associated protein
MRPILLSGLLWSVLSACAQQFVLPGNSYQSPRLASRGVATELSTEFRKEFSLLPSHAPILIGPAVTLASGEITKSGRELQTFLMLDLKALMPDRVVERMGGDVPVGSASVITATVAYERPNPRMPEDAWFIIDLAVNNKEGRNRGSVAFRINARQFDPTPSRFFQQSPIFQTIGKKKESGNPGNSDVPAKSFREIENEAKSDRGIVAYEAGQYADAKKIFQEVSVREGSNLLALSGVYQSELALGNKREAEAALDRLIDAGIEQGTLSFKFLFRVRSAEFRDDYDIAEQYAHWISRVANRLSKSSKCLRVEGHASRSGSAVLNEALSKKRADRVSQLLVQQSSDLKLRIKSSGLGFSKNIVGSGTDDATDAVDRRVEFVLHSC